MRGTGAIADAKRSWWATSPASGSRCSSRSTPSCMPTTLTAWGWGRAVSILSPSGSPSWTRTGTGGGTRFAEIGLQAGPALAQKMVARGCAVADYDGDGDPDLVVTENNRPAHLFRNDSPSVNRYLRVVLRGKRPNRDAVGARVVVTAGGLRQIQSVRAGGHYYSQSEFPLTFGVGSATTADIDVTWPRGGASRQRGISTNQAVTISE